MAGLLGNIFGALGSGQAPDIQSRPLSQQAETLYNDLFKQYSTVGKASLGDLDAFRSQYSALTPQIAGLAQEDIGTYDKLIKAASARDPIADMERIGNFGFDKLTEWGRNMADYGTREDSLRKAAAGLGNRGPTAYDNILATNRISGNLLPAFNNIISNIGPNYSRASQDYFGNLQAIPGLMAGRYGALDMAPYRALVPGQMQRADLMANLNSLNQINAGNLSNRYFYEKPNWMTTAGNVASGVYQGLGDAMDLVNKAASTYGNVLGAGSIGGGGMGGMTGGGGGGQGVNISQILGLLNQMGVGQQSGQPNLSGGSNLNTGQFPGESLANMGVAQINTGYGQPSQYGGYLDQPSIYGQAPVYGGYGVGYNQNPYAQYGAYF